MARSWFGGDLSGYVITPDPATHVVSVVPGSVVTFWDAQTGGAQYTDLVDAANNPASSVTVDDTGALPLLRGPDGVRSMWAQADASTTRRKVYGDVSGVLDAAQLPVLDVTKAPGLVGKPGYGRSGSVAETMLWAGLGGHPYVVLSPAGPVINLNDTSDCALGDRSISMTTPGNGAQTSVGNVGGLSIDMTGKIPVVWLKVLNPARVLQLQFRLASDSSFTNAYRWELTENAAANPWLATSGWVRATLPLGKAAVDGAPDATALESLQIQVYDDSGGAVTVYWGGLALVPAPAGYPHGLVSLTFDDGFQSHYDVARPYMDGYGWRGSEYIVTETMRLSTGGYMSIPAARKLQDINGWDICSHAYSWATHDAGYGALTPAEQYADMLQSKDYLLGQGFTAVDHFAWPLGNWAGARDAAARLFLSGRTNNNLTNESVPVADPLRLRATGPINTTSLATLTGQIDQAHAAGEWLILIFHDIVTTPTTQTQVATGTFQAVCDHIAGLGDMPVKTITEVMEGR